MCMSGNEVGSGDGGSEIRDKESHKGDVEREDGLDTMTMSHVEEGVAGGFVW
jgi:hypothetical protein